LIIPGESDGIGKFCEIVKCGYLEVESVKVGDFEMRFDTFILEFALPYRAVSAARFVTE
jgi:hypothetical protein